MNRFSAFLLAGLLSLSASELFAANSAPIVAGAIPEAPQFAEGPARSIDLSSYFTDPDASSAVHMETVLGAMNIVVYGTQKPITVANFLNYVNSGRYFKIDPATSQLASSFIHRSVPNFVIQGGGFIGTTDPKDPNHTSVIATAVATFPSIQNEPGILNTRGTIAMAKTSDPNSATSQWFINLANNTSLDNPANSGGFTVFGRVAGTGMTVADAIAAVPRYNFGDPFAELPLRNYTSPNPVRLANVISLPVITQISPLNFSASSSNPAVATVAISGTRLLVSGKTIGSAVITVTATDLDGATVSQGFNVNVITSPGRLGNLSTRAAVGSDQNALIGGFFVQGNNTPKRLIIRAIGPSLVPFGVMNPLPDPVVELHGPDNALLATNDNWETNANKQEIIDTGLAPGDPKEAAILTTVPVTNGSTRYTAIVSDAGKALGIGLVEVFDLDSGPGTTLVNLSTRGHVGVGDDVMIGGIVVSGTESKKFVVRAIGPSLGAFGVTGPLDDPILILKDANGNQIDANNDWQTNNPNAAEIQTLRLDPKDSRESALLRILVPGRYTATVQGGGDTPTGVAVVEVYQVQ